MSVLDNLRAIVMGILECRHKEAYWREKWAQYKGRRKWRKVKPKQQISEIWHPSEQWPKWMRFEAQGGLRREGESATECYDRTHAKQ